MISKKSGPLSMMVIYRAKKGHEAALLQLVKMHWPVIYELGLATSTPARVWKTTNREGKVAFVEMFEWRDAKAPQLAHQSPEVMAVWEPMASVMEGVEIAEAELLE
jgi:hypothetical protein